MKIQETITFLKEFNKWRRGKNIPQPNPKEIGLAIDSAIKHLENKIKDEKNSNLSTYYKN